MANVYELLDAEGFVSPLIWKFQALNLPKVDTGQDH
jgi:hypothetical protein